MNIKILMITYNRPKYTSLSLEHLCASVKNNVKLTIWDNGSGYDTKNVLKQYEKHPAIEKIIYNKCNDKLRKPTNWFWEKNKDADLIGKVDDDCLVPIDWISKLEKAHYEIPKAGAIACWHFLPEDYNHEIAKKKIENFGKHKILRNCWVGGSGYLMKRSVIKTCGFLRRNETFTDYCIRSAAKGFVNGWYYPFICQEHMDDPRVPNTGILSEEDFQRLIPLSARKFGIKTKKQWVERLKSSASHLQEYSINPYDFIGVKAKFKRKAHKLLGLDYFPKAK